jgi:hypothetical protein
MHLYSRHIQLILGLFLIVSAGQAYCQSNHPKLKVFTFLPNEEKLVKGLSTDIAGQWGCNKGILAEDIVGNLALVSELYQNGCYTDGRYNHSEYKVELGSVLENGSSKYTAYRIYGPNKKAAQFLGSHHKVHLRFDKKANYVVYSLLDGVLKKELDIPASAVEPGKFIKMNISASTIDTSKILFALPEEESASIYHSLSSDSEGAMVYSDSQLEIHKTRYRVSGKIFDTSTGYKEGPSSHANIYGDGRHFFYQNLNTTLQILWQDDSTNKINLTTLNLGKPGQSNVVMSSEKGSLAAATCHEKIWYILQINTTDAKEGWLMSVDSKGTRIATAALDLSKDGLNIYNYKGSESGSLVYNQGTLGLIISRTMNRSGDGLNHQGAIALTFDANTLKVLRNFGQTSGHSFDNILYPRAEGGFLGMDLGDNYPRGINMHMINSNMQSKVIYTFKTAHGQQAQSPAGVTYPKYTDISGDKTFYQWSNDNSTYTELGGIVEWTNSYDVYFIGEPDPSAKAINNARAIDKLSDARDIGYVKIKKDFTTQTEYVLSNGPVEKGGFFTFGGRWSDQQNKGVKWLTNYEKPSVENASRLKAIRVNDEVLLFWEKWTDITYVSTYMMRVDGDGNPKGKSVDLGSHLRLNRRDEPIVVNNRVVFVMGNEMEGRLEVVEVKIK